MTITLQYGILHNAKTAGSALRDVIEQHQHRTQTTHVQMFGHSMTLPLFVGTYPEAKAIFFIRDPISRFVSSFYSRLRQGQPRYYFPWSGKEKAAFHQFSTPNQLAEALSSINLLKRRQAYIAMNSIRHVKSRYSDFLGSIDFLNETSKHIALIGHQPDFDSDLAHIKKLLSISDDITAPNDDIGTHRNPKIIDRALSMLAIENLENWFRVDYEIYRWCLAFREARLASLFMPFSS